MKTQPLKVLTTMGLHNVNTYIHLWNEQDWLEIHCIRNNLFQDLENAVQKCQPLIEAPNFQKQNQKLIWDYNPKLPN